MALKILKETCKQHYKRLLSEGWKVVKRDKNIITLKSPDGFIKTINLGHDFLTLRPNANGDETSYSTQYPDSGEHWDKVDEATADDDSTYIEGGPVFNGYPLTYIVIKENGTITAVNQGYLTDSYALYSNQWNTRPSDGANWTVNDIDNLQIGVRAVGDSTQTDLFNLPSSGLSSGTTINYVKVYIRARQSVGGFAGYSRCTQVYVEIEYTSGTNVTITPTIVNVSCYVFTPEILTDAVISANAVNCDIETLNPTLKTGTTISGLSPPEVAGYVLTPSVLGGIQILPQIVNIECGVLSPSLVTNSLINIPVVNADAHVLSPEARISINLSSPIINTLAGLFIPSINVVSNIIITPSIINTNADTPIPDVLSGILISPSIVNIGADVEVPFVGVQIVKLNINGYKFYSNQPAIVKLGTENRRIIEKWIDKNKNFFYLTEPNPVSISVVYTIKEISFSGMMDKLEDILLNLFYDTKKPYDFYWRGQHFRVFPVSWKLKRGKFRGMANLEITYLKE